MSVADDGVDDEGVDNKGIDDEGGAALGVDCIGSCVCVVETRRAVVLGRNNGVSAVA